MALIALVFDPERSAFFAVLAVGVLILRSLENLRIRLETLERNGPPRRR
jgi:hypothetical protein